MENFSYIEEQKMIHKFWKVHDKIFSLPAKRYIFCHIDDVIGGTTGPAYDGLRWDKIQNVVLANYDDLKDLDFQFGDKLIIVRCDCDINIENDIYIDYNKESNPDIPIEHVAIILRVNFLYYRQYAQLMRESLENFHKPFTPTKMFAFEKLVEQLNILKRN